MMIIVYASIILCDIVVVSPILCFVDIGHRIDLGNNFEGHANHYFYSDYVIKILNILINS